MKKLYTVLLAFVALVSFPALAQYSMANYTITPGSYSTVAEIENITIHWEGLADGIDSHINPSNVGEYVTLTCGDAVYKAKAMYAGISPAPSINDLLIVFDKMTEPGKYVLKIQAGIVKDYDQAETADEGEAYSTNGYIEATYTIAGAAASSPMGVYTLDPVSGASVAAIKIINIDFPETANLAGIGLTDLAKDKIKLSCGEKVYSPEVQMNDSWTGAALDFGNVNEPGVYTLKIEPGAFYLEESDTDEFNTAITASYTVKGGAVEPDPTPAPETLMDEYTLDPASGSSVRSIKKIAIEFPKTAEVEGINEPEGDAVVTCGEKVYTSIGFVLNNDYTGGYFLFEEISEPGTYTLTIAAGIFSDYANGSDKNLEIKAVYTVTGGEAPAPQPGFMDEYTLNPADGSSVAAIEEIKLTFPKSIEDGCEGLNYPMVESATLTCGETVYKLSFILDDYDFASCYLVPVEAIETAGVYTLHIPAGMIPSYDDEEVSNPEITATFTVTGASGIINVDAAADSKPDVVDLMGRTVLRNAAPSDLKTLAPGIYIVNGRKFIVR